MSGERVAVVVGINEYADKEIKPLQGAVHDAQEVRDSLAGPGGGFTILHYLTGPDATNENIRRALYDLLWKSCDPCELAMFYFSGHGVQDGHFESYLAPWDVGSKELLVRGIKMLELKQLLLGAKNRDNAIMILDCCHSGVMATGGERDITETKHTLYDSLREREERQEEVKEVAKGTGKFILASAGPNEKAREKLFSHRIRKEGDADHYHGLFTFHLLEGLNGEAAEEDNEIYLTRLQEHISNSMARYPDHEPYYWGFGKGQIQKIRLVTACRKQEIDQQIQAADLEIRKNDFCSLVNAIGSLSQAIKSSPESRKAIDLKERIEEELQKYCKPVSLWLIKNKYKRGWPTKYPQECRRIEKALASLSFDGIAADLESDRASVLVDLCRVALNDMDLLTFERELASVERRPEPDLLPPPQEKVKDLR
jgi:hypothetical protein